jgi:hypothetical protein
MKRFIFPFYYWALKNAYMFAAFLAGYLLLYLYDFDYQRLGTELSTKLVNSDKWFLEWLITPLVWWVTPLHIILGATLFLLIMKIYEVIWLFFKQIKQLSGDLLISVMWCYYLCIGDKENSVMLITKDEAKSKMYMYTIIAVVLILLLIIMVGQRIIINPFGEVPANMTIGNQTIEIPFLLRWI